MKFTKEGKIVLGGTLSLYLFVLVLKLQTPADDVLIFFDFKQ